MGILPQDNGSQSPVGYLPDQIRAAYGIDNILFGKIQGDGTGQTIAIVDAYDDPSFVDSSINGSPNPSFASSDLAQFDLATGLTDPPSFTKFNESGQTTNLPGTDPAGPGNLNGNWEIEEALDIEWAHAIAPGANIDLVEATTDSNNDLFTTVKTAAGLPGVSAVSMSWRLIEYSGEQTIDSTFTTPSGHQGVTFVAQRVTRDHPAIIRRIRQTCWLSAAPPSISIRTVPTRAKQPGQEAAEARAPTKLSRLIKRACNRPGFGQYRTCPSTPIPIRV